MKKIISVVLSLAMFLSVFGSITVFAANTNDLDFDTDTYTYKMGSTNGYIGNSKTYVGKARLFGFGKWNISATETGTTELGTISKISKFGKTYAMYDFNEVTIKDSDTNTGNYIRFKTNGYEAYDSTYGRLGVANAMMNTVTNKTYTSYFENYDKMYKYTFYAYSNSQDTEHNLMNVNVTTGETVGVEITPAQLYSENEVPHKVDFVLHKSGSVLYATVYIDGAIVVGGRSSSKMTEAFTFTNYLASVKNTSSDGYYAPAIEWVVEYIGTEIGVNPTNSDKVNVQSITREELNKELFIVPTAGTTTAYTARTDDIITGVYDDVDAALVETLTSTTLGDKKIVIPAKYTTVGSLFDGSETNVKAIKTDGSAAASTDLVENVMLMVNGVYVDVEREPLVKGLTVNSDGLATLTYDGTSGLFIVAAYDDSGRMINVNSVDISKESAEEIDSMYIYTLRSSLTSGVKKYKAFLLDGFVNCIPMLNSAEIIN